MTYHRRIVTGPDIEGRSVILMDGVADDVAWATAETLVDNSGVACVMIDAAPIGNGATLG